MRPFTLIAVVTLSLASLAGAALAEPPAVKSDSAAMQAAKAKSLNRMSVGVYRSLRVTRSSAATAMNASLKSNAQGAVNDQKLNVQRAALTNRKMPSNVTRSAHRPQLQSLTADDADYGAMGLAPTSVPNTARMNKLR
jgi:hypothetical protein